VLGILWVCWVGSILAVIFGHISLSTMKRSMGRLAGRGMAIAGLVLGYVGVASLVLVIVLAATGVIESTTPAECRADRSVLALAEDAYYARHEHYTNQATLVSAGYIKNESDLHSVELLGGGPEDATGYVIVNEGACA